jgi:hypothetical protein
MSQCVCGAAQTGFSDLITSFVPDDPKCMLEDENRSIGKINAFFIDKKSTAGRVSCQSCESS